MIDSDTEPIHTYSGLSYSSHLVVDPVRTSQLPQEQQDQLTTMLDQLQRSFPDINPRGDEMLAVAAYESEYGELSTDEMHQADISSNENDRHDDCDHQDEAEEEDCDAELYFYDWRGDSHDHLERVQVPIETEERARAAGRTVISRTLLQSMPAGWQARFVVLLEAADDVEAPDAESYDIRFYTSDGARTTDPIPHYSRGRTRLAPAVIAP
jgi:hypothetical protein